MKLLDIHTQPTYSFLPKWMSTKAMYIYVAALLVSSIAFMRFALPWWYILAGAVEVIAFLYCSNLLTKRWHAEKMRSQRFEKYVFWISFVVRLIFMLLIYFIFMDIYGNPFGFDNGDACFYDSLGQFVSGRLDNGKFDFVSTFQKWHIDLSDMGYGIYLGFIYFLTGNSILAARILKCVWSALTVILIYRIARRNFDENTARMAAIFVMLWPNFWYYCAVQLKEVEMVFLGALFVEQAELLLRSHKFDIWRIVVILLIAGVLFTFRTPLALVAVMTLLFGLVMSSSRVVGWWKRILVGVLAVGLIGVTMGNRIQEQTKFLTEVANSDYQKNNMQWRSTRENGNKFAKYAGAAVFAPMIFTIPFPTMTDVPGQYIQKLNHGGNYIKNILSGFCILAMFILLLSGEWRDHLLPIAFMLGYLVVLTMSNFAQSERFHQPAAPFELMFAAYGICHFPPKYKKYFNIWLAVIFIACVGWQWIKLKGRGL